MNIYADSEDNSLELAAAGRSGFEKMVTQIAGVDDNGKRFHDRPKLLRKVRVGGIMRHDWDSKPFLNWCQSRAEQVNVYAHNVGYDLGNIWPDSPDAFDVTMVGNRIIMARWRNLTFKDSANLWPMKLEEVGEAVGLKKLPLDVNSREYQERDVDIVRKAIQVATGIGDEFATDLSSTLGSFSVRLWQAMGGRNWHNSMEPCRLAYYGGRTEIFQRLVERPGLYTDVNSLYPSVMMLPFPDAANAWFDLPSLKDAERLLVSDKPCFGVADVTLHIPEDTFIPPLPCRTETDAIQYAVGRVEGWWTVAEIRRAFRMGARLVKLRDCYGSLTASRYYDGFVTEFYRRREEDTDKGRKKFFKLLLNNLYGQLGMTGKITRSVALAKHIKQTAEGWVLTRDGTPYGTKLLTEMVTPLSDHVNWMHAAHVTAYGRLRLLDFMEKLPWKSLIYCDTDSIFFEWPEGVPPPFELSSRLGEMKKVDELAYTLCVAPKMWRTRNKAGETETKAKGVPNRKGDDGRMLPDVFMDEARVCFTQPWKLRETIVYMSAVEQERRKMEDDPRRLSTWHPVEKRIVSGYDKKILRYNRYFPKKLD